MFSLMTDDLTYQGGQYEPSFPVNLKNPMAYVKSEVVSINSGGWGEQWPSVVCNVSE